MLIESNCLNVNEIKYNIRIIHYSVNKIKINLFHSIPPIAYAIISTCFITLINLKLSEIICDVMSFL